MLVRATLTIRARAGNWPARKRRNSAGSNLRMARSPVPPNSTRSKSGNCFAGMERSLELAAKCTPLYMVTSRLVCTILPGTASARNVPVTQHKFPIAPLRSGVAEVTERIHSRSQHTRHDYLARMQAARSGGAARGGLGCANFAHGFAAANADDKQALRGLVWPNIAIVSAYNDMLSAHQPLERFPALIKLAAREAGAVAQFAGGVPAMCDGVTQGLAGVELSLFSRDVIAMATAVALSHDMFDAALCLGVCDKIVPGVLIGALSFGHLPVIFVPGGPMPSGLANLEKARVRQLYAQGKADRQTLLESEARSYHAPGTCTFYGTANSNQMLMEVMGLH